MPDVAEVRRLYWRFYRAVRKHDTDTVVSVITAHPQLHRFSGQAGTLLEILDRHAPQLLEPAFQAGLSPDAVSESPCQTLLQTAACAGQLEMLRLLLRYGVDTETRNHSGEVALGYACSWGQLGAVKLLVEAGADVNAVEEDPESGYRNTPLDCTHNYPEISAYLRSKGAKHLDELDSPK